MGHRWSLSTLLLLLSSAVMGAEPCIDCHQQRDAELISEWRQSGHSAGLCTDCHDASHTATNARRPATCSGCHTGSEEHSYRTSKHGVIARLESKRTDWSLPLQRGNYRAPSCGYCHLYSGNHNSRTGVGAFDPLPMITICSGCHSPRYAQTQLAAGERLKQLGRLKQAEAIAVRDQAAAAGMAVVKLDQMVDDMQQQSLANLRLGSGHQSPDYQWWHGQAALDGWLLRIKGLYSDYLRPQP